MLSYIFMVPKWRTIRVACRMWCVGDDDAGAAIRRIISLVHGHDMSQVRYRSDGAIGLLAERHRNLGTYAFSKSAPEIGCPEPV